MQSSARLRSIVCWGSAVILFIAFLPTLWFYVDRAFRMVLETNNEGWVAYFADRAVHHGTLYPTGGELVMNNYPPLSFYIIGAAGRLIGNTVLAGRLISFLALFAIALTLGGLVVRSTARLSAGAFTAAFFLTFFSAYPGGRIGLNDPQLLGQAVMMAGLAVLWTRPQRFGTMLAAALVMVLAGLIKHNIIAIPLGVTAWAAWRGRAIFLRWMLAAILAGLIGGAILMAFWGEPALASIMSPRQVSLVKALTETRAMLYLAAIPLAAWLALLVSSRQDREEKLDDAAILATALVGGGLIELIMSSGGYGVVANMAFDLIITLSLALGLAVGSLWQAGAAILLMAVLVFHVALVMPLEGAKVLAGMLPSKAVEEAKVRAAVAYVRSQPGAVLCFDPVICWYASKPFLFDPFNMSQQFVFGQRNEAELLDRVRRREFGMFEMVQGALDPAEVPSWGRLTTLLQENYEVARKTGDFVFLVPKSPAS